MRKKTITILLLLFISILSVYTYISAQEPILVDETIARVNRDLITRSTLLRAEQGLRHELEQQFPGDKTRQDTEFNKLSKLLLASLVDDKLVSQRADELGINVDSEVNQTLIELCKQNNLPLLSDCQEAMEKQGINLDEVKNNFRTQLQRRSLLSQEVYNPTLDKITEREKQGYYDKHKDEFSIPGEVVLSEIFIGFTSETITQAESRAKEALEELKSGKEFAIVVKKYSDDTRSSKGKGGTIPVFKENDLADDIKKEVDKLQPGQITSLLKWKNGFQIIRLESRVSTKSKSYDEVAVEIAYKIATEKSSDKVKEYFKKLRSKAFIQLSDQYKDVLVD